MRKQTGTKKSANQGFFSIKQQRDKQKKASRTAALSNWLAA
jgi:hypothetical protein